MTEKGTNPDGVTVGEIINGILRLKPSAALTILGVVGSLFSATWYAAQHYDALFKTGQDPAQIALITQRLSNMTGERDKARNETQRLSSERDDALRKLAEWNQQRDGGANQELLRVTAQRDDAVRNLKAIREQNDRVVQERNDAVRDVREAETTIDGLKKQLAALGGKGGLGGGPGGPTDVGIVQKVGDFVVTVSGCGREAPGLMCNLTVLNKGAERTFRLYLGSAFIIDPRNEQQGATQVQVGLGQTGKGIYSSSASKSPRDGTVKATVGFPPVPDSVTVISKLHLKVQWSGVGRAQTEELTLSNVPVR